MRRLALLVLGITLASGCSHGRLDLLNRGDAYDDAQRRFTRALRWNQLAMASAMVDPELREDFLLHAEEFSKLRFTDYEILHEEVADDFKSANLDVVFYAYTLSSMLERSITVRQEWRRDEDGQWWVRPEVQAGGQLPANAADLTRGAP